jgi:hypothetical protein
LCRSCGQRLGEDGISDPSEVSQYLSHQRRWRYLEILSDPELEDMEGLVDAMRLELDAQQATRGQRAEPGTRGFIGRYPDPGEEGR